MTTHVSAEPFLPGEYIKDEMQARGWTQDDLADVMGITRRQLINLIQGKSGVTPDTAHRLADAFGQSAQTWMNLQVSYELALAAKEERDVARRAALFGKAPVREMKRRRWIAAVDVIEELEAEVCRFLRIASIDAAPSLAVAARKSTSYDSSTPAQVAWFCRVRELGERVSAARYDDKNFDAGVKNLLALAASPEDVRRAPHALAEMGVRLVIVQHLQGTKIDGVATWLSDDSPVIGLSVRFDRIDNFWFNLLHELIHVKYRDQSPVDVDLSLDQGDDVAEIERRANAEAAERLIPRAKLDSFISRHKPLYYQKDVVRFAQARGVHPAIVVGQLKRYGGLPQTHFHRLQAKVRELIAGQALTDGWGSSPPATV